MPPANSRIENLDSVATLAICAVFAKADATAIGQLYDRYAPILLPLAVRIVRDRPEAEDVIHDAFVTVSDRASQYAPDRGTVAAWLVQAGWGGLRRTLRRSG